MESIVQDTPPHTKLVQLPYGCGLILTPPECNSSQIVSIIERNWRTYYSRVQLLCNMFDRSKLNVYYPSIDRHGRIVFPALKKPLYIPINSDTEINRRIWLLEKSTTSFLVHYEVDSRSILDKLLTKLRFDYIFYDSSIPIPRRVEEIRETSPTPPHVLENIYSEIESSVEV
jgi:hypothetical protein